eukprot:55278-Prorocentrum_minimum.AAC.2
MTLNVHTIALNVHTMTLNVPARTINILSEFPRLSLNPPSPSLNPPSPSLNPLLIALGFRWRAGRGGAKRTCALPTAAAMCSGVMRLALATRIALHCGPTAERSTITFDRIPAARAPSPIPSYSMFRFSRFTSSDPSPLPSNSPPPESLGLFGDPKACFGGGLLTASISIEKSTRHLRQSTLGMHAAKCSAQLPCLSVSATEAPPSRSTCGRKRALNDNIYIYIY